MGKQMKMKRVFKCNFCFDSKEIWDGIKKEYYPCNKCSTEERGNGLRDAVGRAAGGVYIRQDDRVQIQYYNRYMRPNNVGGGIYYRMPPPGVANTGRAVFNFYRLRGGASEYLLFDGRFLEISVLDALLIGCIDNTVTPLITFSTVDVLPSSFNGEPYPILRVGVNTVQEIQNFLDTTSRARLDIALSIKTNNHFITTHRNLEFLGYFNPNGTPPAGAVYQYFLNEFIETRLRRGQMEDAPERTEEVGPGPNVVHVEPQRIRLEDVTIEGDGDLDEDIFEDPTGLDDIEPF